MTHDDQCQSAMLWRLSSVILQLYPAVLPPVSQHAPSVMRPAARFRHSPLRPLLLPLARSRRPRDPDAPATRYRDPARRCSRTARVHPLSGVMGQMTRPHPVARLESLPTASGARSRRIILLSVASSQRARFRAAGQQVAARQLTRPQLRPGWRAGWAGDQEARCLLPLRSPR